MKESGSIDDRDSTSAKSSADSMRPANAADPETGAPSKDEHRRHWRAVRRLIRAQSYYGAALVALGVLTIYAHLYAYFGWDVFVAHSIQHLPVPGLFKFMAVVSIPGNSWHPYVLTAITVLVFFAVRRNSEAFGLTLSAAGSGTVNRLIKLLIARPRPTADIVEVFRSTESFSFPSGHVTFYVCYFGFLFFVAYAVLPRGSFVRRVALFLTAVPVALVGLSRVTLGVHWPSDTLGAYLLGSLWLALSLDVYRRLKRRAALRRAPAS